jgi:hypothetical protein
MRHIIQNYKHSPGYHCGSSGIKNLLSYYGCNISEDMVIGLGEAPSFYYFSDPSFDPVKIIHTRFGYFEETFIKNTGLPFRIESGLENAESWLAVRDYIKNNIPVMVRTDIFYLPYFDSKVHFNGHIVVAWGFDEENNEVYLSDTLRPETQTVSITDLILARASKTPPYMEKNIIFTISENVDKTNIDIVGAAIVSLRSWGERHIMSGAGIHSLKNLKEDLSTWEGVESRSWCERFAYQQIERRGTGGAAFRKPYLGFLKELREHIKDASLNKIIELFSKNVESWHRLAALFKEKSEGKLKDYFEIAGVLDNIIALETEAAEICRNFKVSEFQIR